MRFARIFRTPNKQKPDTIEYRMKGIRDFYEERRYQLTIEEVAQKSFKQKLGFVLQILFSQATLQRLRKFLHGGKLPPDLPPPQDLMD